MRRHRDDPEPEYIVYTPPKEARMESRLEHEHTQSEWRLKLTEFHFRCAYCGVRGLDTPEHYLTRDHIRPVAKGGDDVIANVVPCCLACNKAKGTGLIGVEVPMPKPRTRLLAWRYLTPLQRLYHGSNRKRPRRRSR